MNIQKFKKPISLLLLFALVTISAFSLSGCGQKKDNGQITKDPIKVTGQKYSESKETTEEVEYPAQVLAQQEAKIIAKTAGTASDIKFKIGDKVKMGDVLAKIDDADKSMPTGQFDYNSNQIKQAKIAVQQALTSFQMAQTNYNNLLVSANKDLEQIGIAKNQAETGKKNITQTTSESLKSAQLAYDTAKIATEQARLAYENRKKISSQSKIDTQTNSETSADSIANTCGTMIDSINSITAFNANLGISISYSSNLGVLDTNSYDSAKAAYLDAVTEYAKYQTLNFSSMKSKADAVIRLTQKTKKMIDNTKYMLSKTTTSISLPQTSLTSTSLTGLQSTVAGYQTSINAALAQIQAVRQGLDNIDLNNDTTLDALEKAYELAKNQEAAAKQSLENLKAGNTSQLDNASFGAESAKTSYESNKTKIATQIAVSKSQVDLAQLQYSNAATALQSLYDIHMAVTPLEGTVTKKLVENGDTISAGQLLAVVSKMEGIKLTLFLDQSSASAVTIGQPVKIKDSDNNEYPGKISSVSLQADSATKRFSVEVIPDKPDGKFALGIVMNVVVPITKKVENKSSIILPLSAIEINSNENYIYIIENNQAKKKPIKINRIEGEAAEISVELDPETQIIIDGNKLVQEGDPVTTN